MDSDTDRAVLQLPEHLKRKHLHHQNQHETETFSLLALCFQYLILDVVSLFALYITFELLWIKAKYLNVNLNFLATETLWQ